jgi:CRISPR system Cascade subunit CasD
MKDLKMKYILMNLQSKLMSFGCYSKRYNRDTNEFPTRSAIYGMILCAMDKHGEMPEMFDKLNKIQINIYSYTETDLLRDFQTIGSGWDKRIYGDRMLKTCDGTNSTTASKIFYKDYLANQHFRVLLEIDNDNFANEIAKYLEDPVGIIYLGRKKCNPEGPSVFNGIFDTKEEAIALIEKDKPLYKYTEDVPDDNKFIKTVTLRDVPIKCLNDYDNYFCRRVYVSEY